MRRHMVRGTRVDEPYVFRIGGTSRSRGRGRHRIFYISHHEHSAMIFIHRVGGVIGELSVCGSRLTLFLSALFFVVVNFTTILAFDWLNCLSTWTGMEPPSYFERSSIVSNFLPKLWVIFHRSDLVRLFLHSHVLFLRPSVSRACGLLRHCSSFKHAFRQLIALIEDKRKREDFLLLQWRSSSCGTVVRGHLGIFALSCHPPHWRLLSRVNHKAPSFLRCSLWWTYPFVGYYSTLGGVEAFLWLCWPWNSS